MRNFSLSCILLCSFCSLAFAGPKEEAVAVVEKWTIAFSHSDVDGIVKLYSPDALFFGTGSKALASNPAEVRAYFEQAFLTIKQPGATIGAHSVSVLSKRVVVVAGVDTITGVRDGKPFTSNGRVTFVLAKRGNNWQIVHFHRSAIPT